MSAFLVRKNAHIPTEREENLNVRLINSFIAHTHCDILIEPGQDENKLIALAATTKLNDRMDRIVKVAYKYFDGISDELTWETSCLRGKSN